MSGGYLAQGVIVRRVFVRGVFGTGGYCPEGICPGVFVRGVFVLEPISSMKPVLKSVIKSMTLLEFQELTKLFVELYITPIIIFLFEPNLFLSISINTLSNKLSLFLKF